MPCSCPCMSRETLSTDRRAKYPAWQEADPHRPYFPGWLQHPSRPICSLPGRCVDVPSRAVDGAVLRDEVRIARDVGVLTSHCYARLQPWVKHVVARRVLHRGRMHPVL